LESLAKELNVPGAGVAPKKGFLMLRNGFIALALLASSAVAAQAAGDAKAGVAVFKRCAVCHTSDRGGGDGLGPNLFGVEGRKAASRPGFAYSGPLQKSGIVWNEANLTKWVAGPARVVPGTKMAFGGVTSKKQQTDVVAYLGTLK
jgi:cytochrome c